MPVVVAAPPLVAIATTSSLPSALVHVTNDAMLLADLDVSDSESDDGESVQAVGFGNF